jgi:hypothetical protein
MELLEDRLPCFTFFGSPWPEGIITFSTEDFAPRWCALALQQWASKADLDIAWAGEGIVGDIVISARDFPVGILGAAYWPGPGDGGDIFLDSDFGDKFSVLLHEAGHALGLGHSLDGGAVMFGGYHGVQHTLTADDVAGIRARYGLRLHDAFDLLSLNNTRDDATPLGIGEYDANLRGRHDRDWYAVTGASRVEVVSTSLLAPSIKVVTPDGETVVSGTWGGMASVEVDPGETVLVKVNERPGSPFAAGDYRITVGTEEI